MKSIKAFTGIEVLGLVAILGAVAIAVNSVINHLPFLHHPVPPNPNIAALATAQAGEAKVGQQYAAATAQALAQAKASDDPALTLAKQLAPKADSALANGLGQLNPEQALWVQNLIANALSAEVAKRAQAEQAIVQKDAQYAALGATAEDLKQKLAASESSGSFWLYWLKMAGLVYALIFWVLPWLEGKFPALKAVVDGILSFFAPVLGRLKATAQADLAIVKAKVGMALAEVRAVGTADVKKIVEIFDGHFNNTAHQADIAASANAAVADKSANIAQAQQVLGAP